MKNILFYDAYAKDKLIGGSCIGLKRLLKHKKNKDLEYYFLVNQLNEKYYKKNLEAIGVKSFYIKFPNELFEYNKKYTVGLIKQIWLFIFVVLPFNIRLAFLLRKNKINRVVGNEGRAVLTIGIAARIAGIPLIMYLRGDFFINHYLTRIAMRVSNGIICISEGLYNMLSDRFKRKAEIINDGIEFIEVIKGEKSEGINILNVAYITEIKGQIVMLKALNELVKKYNNIRCFFVGEVADKKYYEELTEYIKANRLEEFVIFTGFVDDVGRYLSMGTIYVQPSFTEGLPLSILEAFMYGLPVVASDLPGLTPVVKDNYTGLIFKKGGYLDLTKKLVELIEDEELRASLSSMGRELVKSKYSIDMIAEKFEEYIKVI